MTKRIGLTAGAPRRRLALPALLLGVLMLAGASCAGGGERTRPVESPPVPAMVRAAEEIPWPRWLEVTAGLNPLRRAMPGTVLMGRVDRVYHHEGDHVGSGTVLARVESRDVAARLAQAEAGVEAARAMERNARLMKERMERLHAHQAASQKNLDDAVAGYDAAAASLRAAEEGVAAARVYVGYSEIVAPFDGVVVERRVEAGDMAAPGMPLFVVEDGSKMKVEAQVPESELKGLRVGDPVEVAIEADGAGSREGELAEILPAADPRSRTFTVRVLVGNADGFLRSGMFARLRLRAEPGKAIALPDSALVRRGPLTGVFVVDGESTARLRWVTVGESRSGHSEILTGLDAGERFVVEPPAGLEDGRRIEVR